jgi:hypothetical protein
MWAKKALEYCKSSLMDNSGKESEGQIVTRKSDIKLGHKVQLGTIL